MKKLRKEEVAEDYCFVCKDGGELLICDYGDCLKCYHPECEGKDESVLDSKERWTCRWHKCSLCDRSSKFQCYTCPTAVCGVHLYHSEFAQVKGHKGFCAHCLLLASLVEKNTDIVSEDGVKVDFEEEASYEQYFREYYEIVKEKEGLTAQMTLSAMEAFQKGKQIRAEPDIEDAYQSEDDGLVSDYDDIGDDEQRVAPARVKKKRKRLSGRMRESDKSNTLQFNGWGSENLIAFLNSIGEETTKPLSLCDVDSKIRRYIHSNKLVTKKMVTCDEKLQSLFHKKSMKIHRISGLLELHFAENVEQLDQEDIINAICTGTDEEDGCSMQPCKSEKKIICSKRSSESVTTSKKKSCYAAVVAENIKLIHMRRTLVEKLLKGEPEAAKDKLLGSLVRIKSDPHDYMQKNSYQLVKVMGVNEVLSSSQSTFLLQVSNRIKCISINDISEEDFTSEECDDLRRRVEAGMINKTTVVDLERKARILHEGITKHWITRRLAILQNLIDRANEKGRRREYPLLSEYLDEKELLQTEAEHSRLLLEVPTVIADVIFDPPPSKIESELPQNIKCKSLSSPNDPDSPGAKSSNVLEGNKIQPKEESSKKLKDFNLLMGLPTLSTANTPLGLRAISKLTVGDTSSLYTGRISAALGMRNSEPDVEDTSSPSTKICQMKNTFWNCLKFDFPALIKSNKLSCFLQSLTTLSKDGDFSLKQIDAMENLIYKFPRLTSDYQFAENTNSDFLRFMESREDVNQYTAERESIETQEKNANDSSLKIQEQIRQLQLKLNAINSEKEALLSRKLALDSKVAKLLNSSMELDTWEIRERKAIKERETVHGIWETFKKEFNNINDDTMAALELPTSEVTQQRIPNTSKETVDVGRKEPSVNAASEALTKINSEDGIEYIHSSFGKQYRPLPDLYIPTVDANSLFFH